jgi:hypothetical protein
MSTTDTTWPTEIEALASRATQALGLDPTAHIVTEPDVAVYLDPVVGLATVRVAEGRVVAALTPWRDVRVTTVEATVADGFTTMLSMTLMHPALDVSVTVDDDGWMFVRALIGCIGGFEDHR